MSGANYSLKDVDGDDITEKHLNDAADNLRSALEEIYANRVVDSRPPMYDDSGTEEYQHTDLESWIDYCRYSKNFKEVANVYDELFTKQFENATLDNAAKVKNLATPNLRLTANDIINKLVLAYKDGENSIGETPSAEDPINSGLYSSAQPEQEMLNAYADRADQAQADIDKAEAAKERGTAKADSVTFNEQCFVLSFMPRLIKHKKATLSKFKKLPYYGDSMQANDRPSNASIMVHDDPFNFINKLLIYPDTAEYFNMKSEDIASLQPELRFFKSFYDEGTGENINTEIKFDTVLTNTKEPGTAVSPQQTDLMSLLNNKRKRNSGVGIKSFNLSFIGTDPFAAKKDLRGKLEIYCASLEELFKKRQNSTFGSPYRYIDLALKSITTNSDGESRMNRHSREMLEMAKANTTNDDLNRLDFAIKAKIGIRPPAKIVAGNSKLMQAISRNTVTVQMTPVTHEFNFNEDGSLSFVIHYVPFIADNYNASVYDIFGNARNNFMDKIFNQVMAKSCDTELAKQLKEANIKLRKNRNKTQMSRLISRMADKQLINYITLDSKTTSEFNRFGPGADIESCFKAPVDTSNPNNSEARAQEIEEELQKEATQAKADEVAKIVLKGSNGAAVSISNANVPYFYLCDLIDTALENVEYALKPEAEDLQSGLEEYIQKQAEDMGALEVDNIEGSENLSEEQRTAQVQFAVGEAREGFSKQLDNFIKAYKEAQANFKKFRVVLGPMEIADPANPEDVMVINLGDIPITVKYFQEFIAGEVTKNDRATFPLADFIKKVLQNMTSNFVNTNKCFGGEVKHRVMINRTEALCYNKAEEHDDLTDMLINSRNKALKGLRDKKSANVNPDDIPVVDRIPINMYSSQPILEAAGLGNNDLLDNSSTRKQYHYLIFYASRTSAIDRYKGIKSEDTARGCHHYTIGRDRGVVKTIKLNRDKRPFLKEARFEASGYDGLKQLIEVYNVDVQSYANFNVFPGAKIFVDPAGWAPNIDREFLEQIGGDFKNLTELGIGGYYDITKVEHTFSPGQFDTSFIAYWTNGIGSQYNEPTEKPTKKKATKCKTAKDTSAGSDSESVQNNRASAVETPDFMKNIMDVMGMSDSALGAARDKIKGLFTEGGNPTQEPN